MAMDFAEAWQKASKVEGWLSQGQGRVLFDGARGVSAPNRIVEIGSHLGRSTILLALASSPDVRVTAIDPYIERGVHSPTQQLAAIVART